MSKRIFQFTCSRNSRAAPSGNTSLSPFMSTHYENPNKLAFKKKSIVWAIILCITHYSKWICLYRKNGMTLSLYVWYMFECEIIYVQKSIFNDIINLKKTYIRVEVLKIFFSWFEIFVKFYRQSVICQIFSMKVNINNKGRTLGVDTFYFNVRDEYSNWVITDINYFHTYFIKFTTF